MTLHSDKRPSTDYASRRSDGFCPQSRIQPHRPAGAARWTGNGTRQILTRGASRQNSSRGSPRGPRLMKGDP
ncbi:MAG: hypothetical protein AAB214_22110, partial [Fibrobacterota bacterium]